MNTWETFIFGVYVDGKSRVGTGTTYRADFDGSVYADAPGSAANEVCRLYPDTLARLFTERLTSATLIIVRRSGSAVFRYRIEAKVEIVKHTVGARVVT